MSTLDEHEQARQANSAVGYLWATLRDIAEGSTLGDPPEEYALRYLRKCAEHYPDAVSYCPRPEGFDID